MSLTNQAYDIIGEWFDSHEGELVLALQKKWPLEYAKAMVVQANEDSGFDPQTDSINLSVLCDQIAANDADMFLESIREIIKDFERRWPPFN
jgi:hypothetical protein